MGIMSRSAGDYRTAVARTSHNFVSITPPATQNVGYNPYQAVSRRWAVFSYCCCFTYSFTWWSGQSRSWAVISSTGCCPRSAWDTPSSPLPSSPPARRTFITNFSSRFFHLSRYRQWSMIMMRKRRSSRMSHHSLSMSNPERAANGGIADLAHCY